MSEDFPTRQAGFQTGSLVAGYRLEASVGAGGMAMVFRARDERLGRLVALKILTPGLASDSAFRRRFIAESRAAAAVDDPHIIPVYEAGEADGVLFIAMRFVGGGDLRRILDQEGTLSPSRAAEFISPVAAALDAAHATGLVHRDVKPGNMLVDTRAGRPDHVYLSDFGISKGASSSTNLTGVGHFIGTVDYSAPEQIQGMAVDGRADQYSLACVTFQLLTGTLPFERDNAMAAMLAHMSAPPPSLVSRRPDLPPAADDVLAKGMAKARDDRYESCGDFADALRDVLGLAPYLPSSVRMGPTRTRPSVPPPSVSHSLPGAPPLTGTPVTHPAEDEADGTQPPEPLGTVDEALDSARTADERAGLPAPTVTTLMGAAVPAPAAEDSVTAETAVQAPDVPAGDQRLLPDSRPGSREARPDRRPRRWSARRRHAVAADSPATAEPASAATAEPAFAATAEPPRATTAEPPPAATAEVAPGGLLTDVAETRTPLDRARTAADDLPAAVTTEAAAVTGVATTAEAPAPTAPQPAAPQPAATAPQLAAPQPAAAAVAAGSADTRADAPGVATPDLVRPVEPSPDVALPGTTTVRRRHRRLPAVAAACVLLGAVGVAVPLMLKSPASHAGAAKPTGPATSGRASASASASVSATASPIVSPVTPPGYSLLPFRQGEVLSLVFGGSDGTLAIASPLEVCLWDIAHRDCARTFPEGMLRLAVSPDGGTVAGGNDIKVSSRNGIIDLWNAATGQTIKTLVFPLSEGVNSLAFSPDGKTLAAADQNGTTYLWSVGTQTSTTFADPSGAPVYSVAFSPDGKTLAAADADGTTYLFNIATGTYTALTSVRGQAVNWVAFSPDGKTLAAASADGITYLFNVATATVIVPLPQPGRSSVTSVAFSPTGGTLATGSQGGSVCLWRISGL